MKAKVKLQGCLMKMSEYSESSLILQVFTRELGSISVLGKGIRKTQNRNQLNPLSEYEFSLYAPQDTGLYLLSESSLLQERNFIALPESWAAADCALELFSALIIPTEESPVYYRLLNAYLAYLGKLESNAILIWWRFLLRVFRMLGTPFHPDLCSSCQGSGTIRAYAKGTAELLCAECFEPTLDGDRYETIQPQSSQILALLPQIGDHLSTLKPSRFSVQQINRLLAEFYSAHFNRELKLKSLKVLEQYYS